METLGEYPLPQFGGGSVSSLSKGKRGYITDLHICIRITDWWPVYYTGAELLVSWAFYAIGLRTSWNALRGELAGLRRVSLKAEPQYKRGAPVPLSSPLLSSVMYAAVSTPYLSYHSLLIVPSILTLLQTSIIAVILIEKGFTYLETVLWWRYYLQIYYLKNYVLHLIKNIEE